MTRAHSIHLLISTILMAGALLLAFLAPSPGSLHGRLQGLALDATLPSTQLHPDPRVVIVDIDEGSLAAEGRWPWPRTRVAELVSSLRDAGAAVVGLDILLPEPGDPEGDALLAAQLAQPEVVGAVAFALEQAEPHRDSSVVIVEVAGLAATLDSGSTVLGHITPLYDPDFVIRRIYPELCPESCHPMLAVAMLARWSSAQPQSGVGAWHRRFCVGHFCQWLNRDGTVSIPYHFPGRFRYISAASVLAGDSEATAPLAGALALVGTSAAGLGDRVATSLSASTPGVEIHALLTAALLDSFRWVQLPFAREFALLAVALLALSALVWPWMGRKSKLASLIVAGGVFATTFGLPRLGYWLDPLPLWAATLSIALCASGWEINQVLSQRRRIYRAFAAYVPPVVLRTLVRKGLGPDALDAQRADVTVFFADITGFTALSEKLAPEQLIEITNHLFSEITDEVHRHKGTLDKFMGDAVMAFWGAPLPQADHPRLAVDCALAVKDRLRRMEGWLVKRGYPPIAMTMGLESGEVTVGNLGSRQRRAYTIMGKTVNLAAHLQQQCKDIGHDILCGPELSRRLGEVVITPLPPVVIRGIEGLQVIGHPKG